MIVYVEIKHQNLFSKKGLALYAYDDAFVPKSTMNPGLPDQNSSSILDHYFDW